VRQILHISDIHFGPPHLPELSEALLRFAERRRPDLVALSGDLTQRARPEQFRAARRFVDRFPVPTLFVPGNHDVPMYRFWERALTPFAAYRQHFSAELEPSFTDPELFVMGVNTAHNWTIKGGRVALPRLLEVAGILGAAPSHLLKVVVAHHAVVPPPRFGSQSVLRNSWEAIQTFSEAGVDLVLSGHEHQTYVASSEEFYPSGRAPVLILHAGTSTSQRGRGSEADQNTFNWIRADERSLTVSHYRWNLQLAEFVETTRHYYPRRNCEPYALVTEGLPSSAQ
jgi:3',5'-cyclic AMP phosphodiesterase CpdA